MSDKTKPRQKLIKDLFLGIESYRKKQIEDALFKPNLDSWSQITTLPKEMRKILTKNVAWFSYAESKVLVNKQNDTFKAVLKLLDGSNIETVFMKNIRGHWSICLSTQVGCAIGCPFCATGRMGFIRNLNSDEIVDQYRFWLRFLFQSNLNYKITNLVFMGMGDFLLNYTNSREAINLLLKNTNLGKNSIVVSTVGIFPNLNKLLSDPLWPGIQVAISLQSADYETRKYLVPNTIKDFYFRLQIWAKKYLNKYKTRHTYLTIEYVMLKDINDSKEQLQKLVKFVRRMGKVKINLIPYNKTSQEFQASSLKTINEFKNHLSKKGILTTIRKSKGQEISAGCGQLGG